MAELFEMVVMSGGGGVMDDTDNKTFSPEPVEPLETFFAGDGEQLHPGADMTSDDHSNQVVEAVAGQLTAGFQFSNASHILEMQGANDNHVSIDMPPHQQVPTRLPLIRAIWTVCFFTLVPAIRAALYKPARGVVFSHHKIAYYLALSAIFFSGLGEATTAFWLSRPGGGWRRLSFGRAVLCASFLPLVAILSITGYGLMDD